MKKLREVNIGRRFPVLLKDNIYRFLGAKRGNDGCWRVQYLFDDSIDKWTVEINHFYFEEEINEEYYYLGDLCLFYKIFKDGDETYAIYMADESGLFVI